MTDLRKPILWLIVLLAILACWYAASRYLSGTSMQTNQPSTSSATSVAYVPPQLPPTAADMIDAQPTTGFQYLVSYTDSGFAPTTLQVHSGDTVRFTNNSHAKLWVAATGDQLYPAVQNGCGSSALDSCGPLNPGEYWQFTFTKTGTWEFYNNLDTSETGTITVHSK
jgi:plastocyanin